MAKIIEFPSFVDLKTREWEVQFRRLLCEEGEDPAVVDDMLPRIRAHCVAIFDASDIQMPKNKVPGRLTAAQAKAMEENVQLAAGAVLKRLTQERQITLMRLIQTELSLSRAFLRGGARH